MTVAEMSERLSNAEFVQWAAYYTVQGQRRQLEQMKGGGGRG